MSAVEDRPREHGREPLPTREQLAAISDAPALEGLLDEVGRRSAKIETDLEFWAEGDEDWAYRARNALALHRHTERLIERRLKALRPRTPMARPAAQPVPWRAGINRANRSHETVSPDAAALMDREFPATEAMDADTVQATEAALLRQIEALKTEREEEVLNHPDPVDRDEPWLIRSAAAIRRAGAYHQAVLARKRALNKAVKEANQARRDESFGQAFVEAARLVLDRDTFLRIAGMASEAIKSEVRLASA